MITLKETKKLIDKKIKETKQHIHDIESTTQDTIYSPHRTVTPISASTGNIVLAQQRYNALKQLKHSVQSIKVRDEKKDTTQNVLIQVKNILETL